MRHQNRIRKIKSSGPRNTAHLTSSMKQMIRKSSRDRLTCIAPGADGQIILPSGREFRLPQNEVSKYLKKIIAVISNGEYMPKIRTGAS